MNHYHLQSILTIKYEKRKESIKSLGLIIDKKLPYWNHLDNAISKGQKNMNSIDWKCSKRWGLTLKTQTLPLKTVIQPQLIYTSPNLGTRNSHLKKLQVQQNRILR